MRSRRITNQLKRLLVAVAVALFAVPLLAVPASADVIQPDSLRPRNDGEPWPLLTSDTGYIESPNAATRWKYNGVSLRVGNPATDWTATTLPRVWLPNPWLADGVQQPNGDWKYNEIRFAIYVRSGRLAQGSAGPVDGSYTTVLARVVCRAESTGDVQTVRVNGSGSPVWYVGSNANNLTVTNYSFNPTTICNSGTRNVFVSEHSTETQSRVMGTGYKVAGIRLQVFDFCPQVNCTGDTPTALFNTYFDAYSEAHRITPSLKECTELFGMNFMPYSKLQIGGSWYTAQELGCDQYIDTLHPDGGWATDFEVVCSHPPQADWLSWDWLPDWVAHYAKCLFTPALGFNTQAVMEAAEGTGAGEIADAVQDVRSQLPSNPDGCGVISSGHSDTLSTNVAVDTCSWGTWADSMKPLLTAFVIIAGLWASIRLIISVFTRRNVDVETD